MTSPCPLFYREIPLTQNKVALVDVQDHEWLMRWKWHVQMGPKGRPYAARKEKLGTNRWSTRYMARQIMGFPDCWVDHVDLNDTLNNTRSNLRLATAGQNKANTVLRCDNKSGFKGVAWHKAAKKWASTIGANGEDHYLGLYVNPEDAARAYDIAAIKFYGEFALTNECLKRYALP